MIRYPIASLTPPGIGLLQESGEEMDDCGAAVGFSVPTAQLTELDHVPIGIAKEQLHRPIRPRGRPGEVNAPGPQVGGERIKIVNSQRPMPLTRCGQSARSI